jgi:hypothetical protein
MEEEQPGTALTVMLQGLNRFLCEEIARNYRSMPPHATTLDQVGFFCSLERTVLRKWKDTCYLSYDLYQVSELPERTY